MVRESTYLQTLQPL
ncbi:hypothetical protein JMJ77_0009946, partial [Colletotrichum scovillei]